jgi:hypothetical protein
VCVILILSSPIAACFCAVAWLLSRLGPPTALRRGLDSSRTTVEHNFGCPQYKTGRRVAQLEL